MNESETGFYLRVENEWSLSLVELEERISQEDDTARLGSRSVNQYYPSTLETSTGGIA